MSRSVNPDGCSGEKGFQNCGKCGLCLAVCPVYKVLKVEHASPRARLQLIKAFENNYLEASPLLKELISKCLMCGSCAATCPAGINHYEKFMDMRQRMVADLGPVPVIKGLVYMLAKEYRISMGAGMAKFGQRLTPDFIARKYRIGNIPVQRFPRFNSTPLRRSLPEIIPAIGKQRGQVVYFTGCATNYLYGDTGNATVSILTRLGYGVIIPKGQTCCGIPSMYHGAGDKARESILANVRAIAAHDFEAVIVDCTTCGAALKDEYPRLLAMSGHSDSLLADARNLAGKTRDILSFLYEHRELFEFKPLETRPDRAAYHSPCHSRNGFNSLGSVRELLNLLPGIDYVPTQGEADCCGGGGTFFYEYPEISARMIQKKRDEVRLAGVDLWLTDCPVCRINLAGNLDEHDHIRVIHPVSVISRVLGCPPTCQG